MVEPTFRKYRALLPENTNLLHVPELSPTRCNSYKSGLTQQVPLYLIYYTTIYQIESYSYKVLDTTTANLLERCSEACRLCNYRNLLKHQIYSNITIQPLKYNISTNTKVTLTLKGKDN